MKKLKVLCINTNGLHNDGITNSILGYYSHMDITDMTVDLLKTKDVDPSLEERIEKLGLGLRFTDYRKNVLRYIVKTAKLIKQQRYDVVHVHGSSAILSLDLLAAWLGGCKVRIAHSRNTECDHRFADKLLRPLFYMLCTERFACGEDAGRWLFGKRPFSVIKNGKDIEKFRFDRAVRSELRSKYHWEGKRVIGHVGNFNYQKNHEFLIEVFADLLKKSPDSELVLMGSGREYMDNALKQVEMLGISDKVHFMGSINNVAEMQQAIDLMLFPSRFEGLPNVVLEWQLAGLPSIISDKITRECAVTDLVKYLPIDQGISIWVDEVLSTELAEDRTERSAAACEEMRKAGFDIEVNARKLKERYKKLIGEA